LIREEIENLLARSEQRRYVEVSNLELVVVLELWTDITYPDQLPWDNLDIENFATHDIRNSRNFGSPCVNLDSRIPIDGEADQLAFLAP